MLSKEIEVSRISLLNYLSYLQKAQALLLLDKEASGIKQLTKPEKIYLGNTNYAYALGGEKTAVKHKVTYSSQIDFTLNETYNFEIGGKNKIQKQLAGVENGYLALDNIEIGFNNEIPFWLFGLMY